MRKYFVLIASIFIMLCLGGIYGFSIFIPSLKAEYGLSTAQTQIIFGFTVATFAISLVIAGRLLQRLSPRIVGCTGALLFGSGYLLASFSVGKLSLLVAGIGVLSGAGIGFGYACSLTIPVKWFPRFKGLITGLSVAGFGGGAIVLSWLVRSLLEKGLEVLFVFRVIAISYGIVVFFSALIMSLPSKVNVDDRNSYFPVIALIKERTLWFLFIVMFTGTFSGILVIGNLKPIGLSYGASEFYATLSISLLAVGNSLGRVIWGKIADKVGGSRSIPSALLFLSVSLILLSFFAGKNVFFSIITFLVGIGFGANFVLYATEISNIYGVDNLGGLYPFVHLSYGIAGVIGPTVAGWLFDLTNSYKISILSAAIVSACGAAIYMMLRRKVIRV
ncbi:MAG: MFS transporter [Actinobacteria bacterium]|nr:MFS transporter [Actinomycetota bacterium]